MMPVKFGKTSIQIDRNTKKKTNKNRTNKLKN